MRRRVRSTLLAALLVGMLIGLVLVPAVRPAVAEPGVTVDASARLLHPTAARSAAWRSARTVGATVTTTFASPTRIDGTRVRAADRGRRIVDARLEFSDGGSLAVRMNRRGDRALAFPARTVRWVRLVVASVPGGQRSVALSGWTLHRGARSGVGTTAKAVAAATVSASSGRVTGTRWTARRTGAGQWLQLRWKHPVLVSAIRLTGGAASAATTIRTGSIRFSDGSSVLVRSLEPAGGSPTTIAFTPRITTSVRFVATSVAGGGAAAVRSFRAYPVGVVPRAAAPSTPTYRQGWTKASSCAGVTASGPTSALRLLCPTNGAQTGRTLRLVLSGPVGARLTVRAWRPHGTGGSIGVAATGVVGADGAARISVDTRSLLHGPTAVRVTAPGVATPLYVQFVNTSGAVQRTTPSRVARGMDLKLDESFSGPLSATRTGAGATYASGKPNYYGVDDFGEAIFAQPDGSGSTASTMPGGYLRIPASALAAGRTDPAGYGRTSTGGLLSSAHAGGSGFSAQYGYFEIRMLAPAGAGTWPAFWLLSSGSLVGGGSTAEVDATELYGADPGTAFQTAHSWVGRKDVLGRSVATTVPGGDWALRWHTYGARITPSGVDLYIDGVLTGRTPPVVDRDQPFFFLVDLALTGDWRSGLAATGGRAALYVDSIRAWV